METAPKRGGATYGAGRKCKYAEKTRPMSISVPIGREKEVRKVVREYLKQYEIFVPKLKNGKVVTKRK